MKSLHISRIMQTLLSLRHFVTINYSKKSQNFKTLYRNIRIKYRPECFCKIISNLSPITYSCFFGKIDSGLDFILHQIDQYTKTYAVRPSVCTVNVRRTSFDAEKLTYLIESWISPGCSYEFNVVHVQQNTSQYLLYYSNIWSIHFQEQK